MIKKRMLFYVTGLLILAFGISLTIKADIGAGAWDALNVGLSKTIGLTVGVWVFIVGFIVLFVNAILLKRMPNFLSLITIFIIGIFIDFWLIIALGHWDPEGYVLKFAVLIVGLFIASVGIAIYLQAEFPLSPLDHLMIAISTRFNVRVGIAKTIGELTGLMMAFLFSGPIGIGTILVTVLIGPFIQFFFPIFERLMKNEKAASRE
ncbi:YitT family protein [Fredinandcohnia sp. SECRCQ15]|uniref:YitT family protein n=2 Tax=Fredinandcohnia quinoae TaxID=2918902 RepID=A0AAW5DUD5_9BACI|nr:YitT family protein [Fredinandcohnia sp. SECRCQ15]MCH1624240.1 YitT family protein [Fredinandcohnia sp. SECRCQ15]